MADESVEPAYGAEDDLQALRKRRFAIPSRSDVMQTVASVSGVEVKAELPLQEPVLPAGSDTEASSESDSLEASDMDLPIAYLVAANHKGKVHFEAEGLMKVALCKRSSATAMKTPMEKNIGLSNAVSLSMPICATCRSMISEQARRILDKLLLDA